MIQVDVIQVQQWLTDISATRGLDALDDGFVEAEASAESFKEHLARIAHQTSAASAHSTPLRDDAMFAERDV